MPNDNASDPVTLVAQHLPFLRRYARALTGSQETGDRYAVATLEALIADTEPLSGSDNSQAAKVALFKTFHAVWSSAGAPLGEPDSRLSARAQNHLAKLTPNTREALLLHSIEGFGDTEIAQIMEIGDSEVITLLDVADREMREAVTGNVLVIEDEAIIAMDISAIVEQMGHRITGVARTRKGAVDLAIKERPDLILADIQLADNSSGIDAVNDILGQFEEIPVIFITAFPERLLTGERMEPAFLITKPYSEGQVRSAVSQAMFFASTETLAA